jgi:hypothetical protein
MKKFLNKAILAIRLLVGLQSKEKLMKNIKNSENQLKRFLQISKILP